MTFSQHWQPSPSPPHLHPHTLEILFETSSRQQERQNSLPPPTAQVAQTRLVHARCWRSRINYIDRSSLQAHVPLEDHGCVPDVRIRLVVMVGVRQHCYSLNSFCGIFRHLVVQAISALELQMRHKWHEVCLARQLQGFQAHTSR